MEKRKGTRKRTKRVISEPPETNITDKSGRTSKKAKNLKKMERQKKREEELKKNPNSLIYKQKRSKKRKETKKDIWENVNSSRGVVSDPHSKSQLMNLMDSIQSSQQSQLKNLKMRRVSESEFMINMETMMIENYPTKILHPSFNKMYIQIMGSLVRGCGLRKLQVVNNLLTSADLTSRQRWKIFNSLKKNTYMKLPFLSFDKQMLPPVKKLEFDQSSRMKKVDFRVRFIGVSKGWSLLEDKFQLFSKAQIQQYIGSEEEVDIQTISDRFSFCF